MGSKILMFLGLLFAVTILISSSMVSVSARTDPATTATETKSDVEVDRWHGGGGGGHGGGGGGGHYGGGGGGGHYGGGRGGGHCHHPPCYEGSSDHEEESGEAADRHYKHKPKKCKHWPHC